MRFSRIEIKDLLIAWLMISLAFAILFSGGISILTSVSFSFIIAFAISALTVGIGFLFHELMHKFIAQKYGLWAEFHASYHMLFLAILFSFFGFIIAAPGAVIIKGPVTREKNGKISLAGPLTNIVLAIIFIIPLLLLRPEGVLEMFLGFGLTINSLLALFNLIPVIPFDGRKIYSWNKPIYFISVIFALLLFLSRYLVL